jgi:membrane fusion protein (multidrug efflux system)
MLRKLFVLFCIFAAASGCEKRSEQPQLPPPTVIVSPVTLEDVSPSSSFLGKLEAESKAAITSRVDGRLQKRLVREGQLVRKGQPLFIIDKAPFQIAVNKADAAVKQARARADNAKRDFDRAKASYNRKAIPKAQYDKANAANNEAQAALKGAQAALDAAKLNLAYTDITSPVAGRVGVINFNEGEDVVTSAVLTNVVGSGPISVVFSVSSKTMADLKKRFSVLVDAQLLVQIRNKANLQIILNDGSVYPDSGTLTFADNSVSAAADSRRFKASFPNPAGELLPGQTVTVRITLKTPVNTVVIPQSAILSDVGGKYVLTVSNAGEVSRRTVALGAELSGGKQVINGGLNDGEIIIVDGVQKAQPGGIVNALSREDYNKLLTSQK